MAWVAIYECVQAIIAQGLEAGGNGFQPHLIKAHLACGVVFESCGPVHRAWERLGLQLMLVCTLCAGLRGRRTWLAASSEHALPAGLSHVPLAHCAALGRSLGGD